MGYYISNRKSEETNQDNLIHTDIIICTEEEMRIARLAFHSECDDALAELKGKLPEDLATCIYLRFLAACYIRQVQGWMNTSPLGTLVGCNYRPSDNEDALRVFSTRHELLNIVSDYEAGKKLDLQEYFLYSLPDEEVLEKQRKFAEDHFDQIPTEDGLLPSGTDAFIHIDFERIVPVTITDRKGFLYYCAAKSDGHEYIVPSNQLFATEAEAVALVTEWRNRRNAAIQKYCLLERSEDVQINADRTKALEWLQYNQDPPEMLEKKLAEYVS